MFFFWKEGVPVMGTVQDGRSLVRESGVLRRCGGLRLFAERFASANSKVASGTVNPVDGSVDGSVLFVKTWVLAPLTNPWGTTDGSVCMVEG